ncbi:MAG TPA: YcxB family protein [Roseateles sp.]
MEQIQPSPALTFRVSYSLSEYLSIVRDHVPDALASYEAEQGKPLTRNPGLLKLLLVPMLCIGFAIKKLQMPVCSFLIDADGIRRTTRLGTLEVPWADVVAVHRYTRGYLIRKTGGAMPLPYRCLTSADQQLLESFIEAWRLERDASSAAAA